MKIVVYPKKGAYRLNFFQNQKTIATGIVELTRTGRGVRPKTFRYKPVGKRQLKPTPPRELIGKLRHGDVLLTGKDKGFESFLEDLQIPWRYIRVCRMCILEDKITPLPKDVAVKYGPESICMDCAIRELRREAGYLGGFGSSSLGHLEKLLELYHDLDRVLGMVQPADPRSSQTLFDRIEAKSTMKTQKITELGLPKKLVKASGVEYLMPVQQRCVDGGLLQGTDMLVMAATASGKTFIGEMAGINNILKNRGKVLFLVPLVALANQKYRRFTEKYSSFLKVSLRTGVSRLNMAETKVHAERGIRADIIVGTYEGVDHMLRSGKRLDGIGTVVIDEVQMLEDPERGHRVDGLITRLKEVAPQAQYLYLSATIGAPSLLAKKLAASVVEYDERPVPLERHLVFTERKEKIPLIKRLVLDQWQHTSEKGYKGQTIVFTNARARCHAVADKLGSRAEPYHAGLTAKERHSVEKRFENGSIAAVITTAALAAGVDFPASQVIFDSLAMGIEWLTVQDFKQMQGRAGRPDFHAEGKVVVLAEPGGSYSRESKITEEEVAINLLQGEMFEVAPVYEEEESSEEFAANAVVCKGDIKALELMNSRMVGEMADVTRILERGGYIKRRGDFYELSPYTGVMARHFIGVERLELIRRLMKKAKDPLEIVTELDCWEEEEGK